MTLINHPLWFHLRGPAFPTYRTSKFQGLGFEGFGFWVLTTSGFNLRLLGDETAPSGSKAARWFACWLSSTSWRPMRAGFWSWYRWYPPLCVLFKQNPEKRITICGIP